MKYAAFFFFALLIGSMPVSAQDASEFLPSTGSWLGAGKVYQKRDWETFLEKERAKKAEQGSALASASNCTNVATSDMSYLWRLSEKGDAESPYELAERCANCGPWPPQEMMDLLRSSAERGYAKAQLKLGFIESTISGDGKLVPPNTYEEAVKWSRMAAEQGCRDAQIYLARQYFNGQGAKQDYAEAYFWYRQLEIADQKGLPMRCAEVTWGSEPNADQAKQNLTPEQIAAVEKRINDWKPVNTSPDDHFPVIDIAGLICRGESMGCKIVDSCGDIIAMACSMRDEPSFIEPYSFASKSANKVIATCRNYGCKSALPKEWTCPWPKGVPDQEYPDAMP